MSTATATSLLHRWALCADGTIGQVVAVWANGEEPWVLLERVSGLLDQAPAVGLRVAGYRKTVEEWAAADERRGALAVAEP